MQVLTSQNNSLVKLVRQLKQRKYRDRLGKILIEGNHLLEEALRWTDLLEQVLVSEGFLKKVEQEDLEQRLFLEIKKKGIPVTGLTDNLFKQLAETETPQGILGIMKKPGVIVPGELALGKGDFGLILSNLQDPGNVGTLLRTADAAGINQVYLTKGTVDPYNPKVLRAAMGSHFHLNIVEVDQEDGFIQLLKTKQVKIVVADVQGAESIYGIKAHTPLMLVLGNEAKGPDKRWLEAADQVAKIPLLGKAESLNVSIAGAIIIYEIVRQNRFDQT
jgi:TrmH family RNA methyltransferase